MHMRVRLDNTADRLQGMVRAGVDVLPQAMIVPFFGIVFLLVAMLVESTFDHAVMWTVRALLFFIVGLGYFALTEMKAYTPIAGTFYIMGWVGWLITSMMYSPDNFNGPLPPTLTNICMTMVFGTFMLTYMGGKGKRL